MNLLQKFFPPPTSPTRSSLAVSLSDGFFERPAGLPSTKLERYPTTGSRSWQAFEAWQSNPLARRIVGLTSQYVVGGGIRVGSSHAGYRPLSAGMVEPSPQPDGHPLHRVVRGTGPRGRTVHRHLHRRGRHELLRAQSPPPDPIHPLRARTTWNRNWISMNIRQPVKSEGRYWVRLAGICLPGAKGCPSSRSCAITPSTGRSAHCTANRDLAPLLQVAVALLRLAGRPRPAEPLPAGIHVSGQGCCSPTSRNGANRQTALNSVTAPTPAPSW